MMACTPALEMTNVLSESNRSRSMTATCSAVSPGLPLVFVGADSTSIFRVDSASMVDAGGEIIFGALCVSVPEKIERTKPSNSSRSDGSRGDCTFSLAMAAPDRDQSTLATRPAPGHILQPRPSSVVIGVGGAVLEMLARVVAGQKDQVSALRQWPIPPVVGVRVVHDVIVAVPRVRDAPRVALLQLHGWQQHQMVEEFAVKKTERVDVRAAVV